MFKSVDDLQKLGKAQFEAATASVAAMARGLQQMAAEASAYAKQNAEEGSAAVTRVMGAKSLDGAVRVQTDYAKSAIDGVMAQAGRMSALMMTVSKDAAQPFQAAMPFDFTGKTGRR